MRFVVKEEDKEELLQPRPVSALAQLSTSRGEQDGDTIVQEALPGHLGVDDLKAEGRVIQQGTDGNCSLLRTKHSEPPPELCSGLALPDSVREGLTSSNDPQYPKRKSRLHFPRHHPNPSALSKKESLLHQLSGPKAEREVLGSQGHGLSEVSGLSLDVQVR